MTPRRRVTPPDPEVEEIAELFGEFGSLLYSTIHPYNLKPSAIKEMWVTFGRKLAEFARG